MGKKLFGRLHRMEEELLEEDEDEIFDAFSGEFEEEAADDFEADSDEALWLHNIQGLLNDEEDWEEEEEIPLRRRRRGNFAPDFSRTVYEDEEDDESRYIPVPRKKGIKGLVFLAFLEILGILAVIGWWLQWLI